MIRNQRTLANNLVLIAESYFLLSTYTVFLKNLFTYKRLKDHLFNGNI